MRPGPAGAGAALLSGLLVMAGLALAVSAPVSAQTSDLVDRTHLRVCADPANMPFSSKEETGYENKLADLLGEKLGLPVTYTWFPQATGFVRRTLRLRKCDVIMGYAQGHELVQNTNHYYRSAYVLLHREDSDLKGISNLDDPRLADKKLGVIAGTPPATVMAMNGLLKNARPFHLMVDRRVSSPAEDIVSEIAAGTLDGGLLWGPMGGYYAKQSKVPITVVPLVGETKGPRMVYRITMGLRPQEPDWKHRLNDFIKVNQPEINRVLLDFGVPLLDEKDQLITK
jgi:quinoprotein dehydrogenase-associated probable ABC transporter substrate-binding protein